MPPESNNITTLNAHFARYGTLQNIQVMFSAQRPSTKESTLRFLIVEMFSARFDPANPVPVTFEWKYTEKNLVYFKKQSIFEKRFIFVLKIG